MKNAWMAAALAAGLLLSACGGGGGSSSAAASGTPASVEITTNTVLLTEAGQTARLSARVLDANGKELNTPVTWESSQPAQMSMGADGMVTAQGAGGSAQIFARVGDIKSPPVLLAYTQVAAGAQLVNDAQIVGEPVESAPNAAFSVDNTYSVRLSGLAAPSIGQIVVNTGNKPVVGRVKAVSTDASGVHTVTLGMVSIKDALPNLIVKESFELNNLKSQTPADVLADYDVVREGSVITLTPKAGALPLQAKAVAAGAAHFAAASANAASSGSGQSVKCEFTVEGVSGKGSPPILLTKLPTFKVEFNPRMAFDYNPIDGLKELVLHAKPTVTVDATFNFDASVDPKLTCTLEIDTWVAPVSGVFAALIGPSVTFYGGVEVSVKTSLKGASLGTVASLSSTVDVGLRNCTFMGCAAVSEVSTPQVQTKTVMSELAENYRFEPSVFVYGMAKAGVANPLLKSMRVEALYAKVGPALNASLARPDGQISDAGYASKYSLDAQLKAGLETAFTKAALFFGLNGLTENLFGLGEQKLPMAQSPTGKATAEVSGFEAGDKVEVDVQLDQANTTFLGTYNVKRVVVLRKTGSAPAREVGSATPSFGGETKFKVSFVADAAGQTSELYAFVLTNDPILDSILNGLPLELGPVTSTNSRFSLVGNYSKEECVKDTKTGLIWEGKTASGVRAGSNVYTNYDRSGGNQFWDGNNDVYVPATEAQIVASTNSIGYVNQVNSMGLCGHADWRMPTVEELQTLVDISVVSGPKIDVTWFPNTNWRSWSSTPYVGISVYAWFADFDGGLYFGIFRYGNYRVRLVRASQ